MGVSDIACEIRFRFFTFTAPTLIFSLRELFQSPTGKGTNWLNFKHWLPFSLCLLVCIAIHRKFQTRRAAKDSMHLYGEAAQHRMKFSVDGYTSLG